MENNSENSLPIAAPATVPAASAPSEASGKKNTPMQYALMSLFIYPGAGQIARKQKSKGIVMALFFTIFLIIWGILAAKGAISLYSVSQLGSSDGSEMEMGVLYLKYSLIPAAVGGAIFVHSAIDAYKG